MAPALSQKELAVSQLPVPPVGAPDAPSGSQIRFVASNGCTDSARRLAMLRTRRVRVGRELRRRAAGRKDIIPQNSIISPLPASDFNKTAGIYLRRDVRSASSI